MCELFENKTLAGRIAIRGGTSINKLLFREPLRYSEDIDLVQIKAEPIKEMVVGIRDCLSWLGKCDYVAAEHSVRLTFKFSPELGGAPLKLKIEINTREHLNLLGLKKYPFEIKNDWHTAKAEIVSFEAEELFGTKLRALLQRRKNRDLFDLHQGLLQLELDPDKVVACFLHYLKLEGQLISRANAEERMLRKLSQSLTEDVYPLLPAGVSFDDEVAVFAFGKVWTDLIRRIPGESWKSSKSVVEAIRKAKFPSLLEGHFN